MMGRVGEDCPVDRVSVMVRRQCGLLEGVTGKEGAGMRWHLRQVVTLLEACEGGKGWSMLPGHRQGRYLLLGLLGFMLFYRSSPLCASYTIALARTRGWTSQLAAPNPSGLGQPDQPDQALLLSWRGSEQGRCTAHPFCSTPADPADWPAPHAGRMRKACRPPAEPVIPPRLLHAHWPYACRIIGGVVEACAWARKRTLVLSKLADAWDGFPSVDAESHRAIAAVLRTVPLN
ncbi:hypothetical protein VUR80DRAFT_5713 [Thermomyces stellatus]